MHRASADNGLNVIAELFESQGECHLVREAFGHGHHRVETQEVRQGEGEDMERVGLDGGAAQQEPTQRRRSFADADTERVSRGPPGPPRCDRPSRWRRPG